MILFYDVFQSKRLNSNTTCWSVSLSFCAIIPVKANFKESYMAAFYDYFNEQKYADAVKNVSVRLLSLLHTVNRSQFEDTWSDILPLFFLETFWFEWTDFATTIICSYITSVTSLHSSWTWSPPLANGIRRVLKHRSCSKRGKEPSYW